MAIDWSNEPFTRLYKRETDDDLLLTWEARAVWHEFLKHCDGSGFLATKRGMQGFAALVRIPLNVVERVIGELIDDGRLRSVPNLGFVAPNYVSANYVARSVNARQAAFRAHQHASSVTSRNGSYGTSDSTVTPGNAESRDVTPSHAVSHEVTRGNENCQSINHSDQSTIGPPMADDAPASKSRTRPRQAIPEEWEPRGEERAFASSLGLDCNQEAAEFKSFWLGDGRPKKNWDQAFRNRLMSQGKRGGRVLSPQHLPRKEPEL